jgi:hypothetical protein
MAKFSFQHSAILTTVNLERQKSRPGKLAGDFRDD